MRGIKLGNQHEINDQFADKIKNIQMDYPVHFQDFWTEAQEKMDSTPVKKRFNRLLPLRWQYLATAFFVLMGLIVILTQYLPVWKSNKTADAVIVKITGQARGRFSDGNWQSLKAGDRFGGKADIQVSKESSVEMRVHGKAVVWAGSDTFARVDLNQHRNDNMNVSIELKQGGLVLKPPVLKKGESFLVKTQHADISVKGTRYSVVLDKTGNTIVAVKEGVVTVVPKLELMPDTEKILADRTNLTQLIQEFMPGRDIMAGSRVDISSISLSQLSGKIDELVQSVASPELLREKLSRFAAHPVINEQPLTVQDSVLIDNVPQNPVLIERNDAPEVYRYWKSYLSQTPPEGRALFTQDQMLSIHNNTCTIINPKSQSSRVFTVTQNQDTLLRPVLGDRRLYFATESGGLYAYSWEGSEIWRVEGAGSVKYNASPLAGRKKVILPTYDKGFEVYSLTGELTDRVTIRPNELVFASPLYLEDDDLLIYGTSVGRLACYNLKLKQELWSVANLPDRILFPLKGNSEVVLVYYRNQGLISAYSPLTGRELWCKLLVDQEKADYQSVVTKNSLYIIATKGGQPTFYEINTASGDLLFQKHLLQNNWELMDIDGTVLLRSMDGALSYYDPKNHLLY